MKSPKSNQILSIAAILASGLAIFISLDSKNRVRSLEKKLEELNPKKEIQNTKNKTKKTVTTVIKKKRKILNPKGKDKLTRTLSFNKTKDSSILQVIYTDVFAIKSLSSKCSCKWSILLNGEKCLNPKEISISLEKQNITQGEFLSVGSTIGYCLATAKGLIKKGPLTIKVKSHKKNKSRRCGCSFNPSNTKSPRVLEIREIEIENK